MRYLIFTSGIQIVAKVQTFVLIDHRDPIGQSLLLYVMKQLQSFSKQLAELVASM